MLNIIMVTHFTAAIHAYTRAPPQLTKMQLFHTNSQQLHTARQSKE